MAGGRRTDLTGFRPAALLILAAGVLDPTAVRADIAYQFTCKCDPDQQWPDVVVGGLIEDEEISTQCFIDCRKPSTGSEYCDVSAGTSSRIGRKIREDIQKQIVEQGESCLECPILAKLDPSCCDDATKHLKQLESDFGNAYEDWRSDYEGYTCRIIVEDQSVGSERQIVQKEEQALRDLAEQMRKALEAAKATCPAGEVPGNPLARFESLPCKRARIDLGCHEKKRDALEWELRKLFHVGENEDFDYRKRQCKDIAEHTAESYQRCRKIKNEELPEALGAVEEARDLAEAACKPRS